MKRLDTELLELMLDLQDAGEEGSDRSIFCELKDDFSRISDRLSESRASGEAAEVSRLAHELTGLAATFGMHEVSCAAEEAEAAWRKGDQERVLGLADELPGLMKSALGALDAYLLKGRSAGSCC